MSVIERIKAIMEKRGLTRADLVNLSGLKKSTVYSLFSTKVNEEKIELETIRAISRVLNVTMDYLIYGEEKEKPTSKLVSLKLEMALNEVGMKMSDLDDLDSDQTKLIVAALKGFLKDKGKS